MVEPALRQGDVLNLQHSGFRSSAISSSDVLCSVSKIAKWRWEVGSWLCPSAFSLLVFSLVCLIVCGVVFCL